jgi:hypothetical protein
MKPALSTSRFPAGRALLLANQQRVRSGCASDVLRLLAYDRCNAQLEFLNGFYSALLLHCSAPDYPSLL